MTNRAKIGKGVAAGVLMAGCAAGLWVLQSGAARGRVEAAGGEAPSPAAEMIVAALGGFRGLASEFIWLRADRLQDEGRYGEMAQLATWLTYLEPKTPEVWAYAAWNLAYNISVMMPTPADRWRWVQAGMRLLRDDGLRINAGDPVLCKELAWLFAIKLGGRSDSAAPYYRERWREIVTGAEAEGDWGRLGMERGAMERLEGEFGGLDWTDPLSSALYWARVGLAGCGERDRAAQIELRQAAYQTLIQMANREGRFWPAAIREMETAMEEAPNEMLRAILERCRGNS